jgi:hypothetical protein
MKKIASLLLVIAASTLLNAQYYQRQYNIAGNDLLTCGTHTNNSTSPYIMAGYEFPGLFVASNAISVVRVNASGVPSGANTYSSKYQFSIANQAFMRPITKSVISIAGSTEVPQPLTVVSGGYSGLNGIFVTVLSATGSVLTAKHYTAGFSSNNFELDAACSGLSIPGSKFVYLAGHVNIQTLTGKDDLATCVICIDATSNTLVWSKIYNINTSTENETEIPSAIINAHNNIQEIIVTGNINTQTGSQQNFILRIDRTTGALIGTPMKMSFPLPTTVRSIANENTAGANQGYILCGDVEVSPGVRDAWAAKVRPTTASVVWSHTFDNNLGGNNDALKIIRGQTGVQYYIAGTATFGAAGHDLDMLVYEIDEKGAVNQLNTYGSNKDEFAANISPNLSTGYCVMGTRLDASGNGDFYAVSAYYNGVSGCKERFNNIPASIHFPNVSAPPVSVINFTPALQPITVVRTSTGTNTVDCNAASLPNGDNARLGQLADEQEQATSDALLLAPNPVVSGASLTLTWNSETEQQAETQIIDMQGRVVYSQQMASQEGKNTYTILPDALASGVYFLVLREGTHVRQQRLIIQ